MRNRKKDNGRARLIRQIFNEGKIEISNHGQSRSRKFNRITWIKMEEENEEEGEWKKRRERESKDDNRDRRNIRIQMMKATRRKMSRKGRNSLCEFILFNIFLVTLYAFFFLLFFYGFVYVIISFYNVFLRENKMQKRQRKEQARKIKRKPERHYDRKRIRDGEG